MDIRRGTVWAAARLMLVLKPVLVLSAFGNSRLSFPITPLSDVLSGNGDAILSQTASPRLHRWQQADPDPPAATPPEQSLDHGPVTTGVPGPQQALSGSL
jgi:hypothetical protein